jgi:hypothetical protein
MLAEICKICKKYAKYAKYVILKKICRICTPHFADVEGRFVSSSNLCGSSCGIPQEEGAGNPGLVVLRPFGAGVKPPG